MCQVFWQPVEPSEALEMLQKVSLVALRALLILAGELLPGAALGWVWGRGCHSRLLLSVCRTQLNFSAS